VPFLVGLKNKTDGEWADPAVGGLILLGLAAGAAFVFVESRAAEPIVPVALFRDRTFAVSCAVVLLSVAGLFVAITFLPRFFQFVRGASATESGWQIMALLFGLILGAIVAGQIVARTGHWKAVLLVGMAVGTIGMLALTRIEAESEISFVWAAMFVTGVGIGPVTSILTAVVQTLVSPSDLAVATGTLTFFRQLGASIWLAVGGSIFTSSFTGRLPDQLSAHGVPAVVAEKFGSSVSSDTLTSLRDLRGSLLASVSADVRATVAPFVDAVVGGIHQAFSVSIGDTFWVGILPVIAAFVLLALLKEVPIPKEALNR
jgi:predicted MFS family arabinose efflux permease